MDRQHVAKAKRPARFPSLGSILAFVYFAIIAFVVLNIYLGVFCKPPPALRAWARRELFELSAAIAMYRVDHGSYPPDDITLVGGSARHGTNEVLVYYLTRELKVKDKVYPPYLGIRFDRRTDADNDGFPEYRDPWRNLYLYAENASRQPLQFVRFRGKRLPAGKRGASPEYVDPFDPRVIIVKYPQYSSLTKPTGMNPKSFDLVSPGPDGELGGTISPGTGYVPATTRRGKARQKDNVTNWGG
jgi:hypothetical protein